MPSPSPALVRAEVAAVLDKVADARVIGISVPSKIDMGDSLVLRGKSLGVTYSDSVLAIRECLAERDSDSPSMVLLTPLDEMELGADIIARLARKRLFSVEPWQLVKQRFRARWVDPRLVERHAWVATALLEHEPQAGYPPAPSGVIEADMAWRFLFEAMLGLPGGQRDPESLLECASDPNQLRQLMELEDGERLDLANAVGDSAGALSRRIFDCISGEYGASALSIGLVARVLFGEEAGTDVDVLMAAGRFERFIGGKPLDKKHAGAWADAAEAVIKRGLERNGIASVRPLLDDADALLRDELHAEGSARQSSVLRLGYEQRLVSFASELQGLVDGDAKELPDALWDAADYAQEHLLAPYGPHNNQRRECIQMGLRLSAWLAECRAKSSDEVASFAEAASTYRRDGGFADWARTRVWDGDLPTPLVAAYTNLSEAAGKEREKFNRRFGSLFENWSSTGSHDDSVIPVEDVLDRVATPLANECPILIVVIDGMGMRVFRELEQDLLDRGFIQLAPSGASSPFPVVSAVPSVTEVSRTSLLSGKLASGTQADEVRAFPKHRGLSDASTSSKQPVLFHKSSLTEPGSVGLSGRVTSALTDSKQRVVGVVINAVDDHLSKGEQVGVHWSLNTIRPLNAVLNAAAEAGRIAVIVSDHGHIPEHQTEKISGGDAERWRHIDTEPIEPRDGELLVEGPRVLLGQGGKVIAPWSERIRFSQKKNGYHGGLSPQEVVIPLGIFSAGGTAPKGWVEIPHELPRWWEREVPMVEPVALVEPAVATPAPRRKKQKTSAGQGILFDVNPEPTAEVPSGGPPSSAWIEELLASNAMKAQRKQAARTAISDERIRTVLGALDERGGKLTRTALANRLSVPAMRVGGILSALRRVLNLDGYPVLSIDEASDTVELNIEVLAVQFGLQERAK